MQNLRIAIFFLFCTFSCHVVLLELGGSGCAGGDRAKSKPVLFKVGWDAASGWWAGGLGQHLAGWQKAGCNLKSPGQCGVPAILLQVTTYPGQIFDGFPSNLHFRVVGWGSCRLLADICSHILPKKLNAVHANDVTVAHNICTVKSWSHRAYI